MTHRVVVWGTGNVGRPAIRAVVSHQDLDLVGVIVSNPDKVGRDAGELASVEPVGIAASDDPAIALGGDVDAVVYTATGDTRPEEALSDIAACLRSGANVVSTSLHGLLHPPTTPPEQLEPLEVASTEGNSSVYVSGIDPGWALDILPLLLSGVSAGITEIRIQEFFNYAHYDQPAVVREVIGFGGPMDELPPMLWDFALEMVWAPMVRVLADGLDLQLEEVRTTVERLPLTRTLEVPGMGTFEEGTQGAFRFEVQGIVGGRPLLVVEHVTRIDDECAPEWPRPANPGGEHRVVIEGQPHLEVTVHGEQPGEPLAAGGGNASAANRIVNVIPAVVAAPSGLVNPLDLPPINGARQIVR